MIVKESNRIEVVAKTKSTFTDRRYFVGDGNVLQLFTVVESVFANFGDRGRKQCELIVCLTSWEDDERLFIL